MPSQDIIARILFGSIGLAGLLLFARAFIAGVIFIWSTYRGTSNVEYDFKEMDREPIHVNPDDVNDPTLWLPEFAQTKRVNVGTRLLTRGIIQPFGRVMNVEIETKSAEQIAAEKRAFYAEREKLK